MNHIKSFVRDRLLNESKPVTQVEDSHIEEYFNSDPAFVDILKRATEVYHHLKMLVKECSENGDSKVQIKILTAELSVLTSFAFIKIMAEISPIDHVEKHRLKIQYIEEDVKMFDALLSVYYMHGVVSGCISESGNVESSVQVPVRSLTENKERLDKVHPYCAILAQLKQKTANGVHKYASGNTFRPNEPSYGNFAKVKLKKYFCYICVDFFWGSFFLTI